MQLQGSKQRTSNFLIGSHSESASLFSKQKIVLKNKRSVKMCHNDLSPYVSPQFGFIDPDFPHVMASVSYAQSESSQEISWIAAEELSQPCAYSEGITALDELCFSKKSVAYALLVIHWFTKDIFEQLFVRQLSNIHLYSFDLMINGVFVQLPIDSYVPVDPNTKQPIFAKQHNGSIFPCLFQKMLAKVYGDYCSITAEFIDIVELVSFYCRQQVSCTQGISEAQLYQIISRKLADQSVVCFRTRNSIRLQSFGLQSNHVYIILQLIQKNEQPLVQFLELEGVNWIGKHSKLRSTWLIEEDFVASKGILLGQEAKENYMGLADLRGIARELIILNNTSLYHKNYHLSPQQSQSLTVYQFSVDKTNSVMFRSNFKHKKCYNSLILAHLDSLSPPFAYNLVASNFSENKSSNYLQAQLNPGTYFIIVYNMHPQEDVLPYHLTVFSSDAFLELRPSQHDVLAVLQGTFLSYFCTSYLHSTEPVVLKHLYEATGMAFILIKPTASALEVILDIELFRQSKIFELNLGLQEKTEFRKVFAAKEWKLLCFACQWSKKENIAFELQKKEDKWQEKIVFPPLGSLKVIQKREGYSAKNIL